MIWFAVVVPPRPGRGIGYAMSMQAVAWPEPDPLVASAIAAKYRGKRPRPLAVLIRDRLGEWLGDEDVAEAFMIRGGRAGPVAAAGWPGGISPPGSHRTERESLPSLRSSHLIWLELGHPAPVGE